MKFIWFVALIALVGLMIFGYFDTPAFPTIDQILDNPENHAGKQVEYLGKSSNLNSSGFLFDNKIWVNFNDPVQTVFGYTSFAGTVNTDGSIDAFEVWTHDYSYFIFIMSIIGAFIFLFIFFREWKISGGCFKCRIG